MRGLTDFRRGDIIRTLNGLMLRWGAACSCALRCGAPVGALAGQVRECRVIWDPDFELPEGVYWFQGVDEGSVILQVVSGSLPGDAMIVPLGESMTAIRWRVRGDGPKSSGRVPFLSLLRDSVSTKPL